MSKEIQKLKQRLSAVEDQFTDVAQAYETLQESFAEMQAVYDYAHGLSTILEFDELFDFIAGKLQANFQLTGYALHFRTARQKTFELRSDFGMGKWQNRQSETLLRILQEVETTAQHADADLGSDVAISYPLINKAGEIIATLTLVREKSKPFQPAELRLLARIAALLAGVIEKILVYEQTRALSLRDELTGVHNRRAFNRAYEAELERCQRYKRSLAVLMLDIDHFKHYNDMHGHLQGDVALKKVAEILGQVLRKTDMLARYGGEEFVILLPETTKEQAKQAANKLRRVIEKEQFDLEEHQPGGRLTISIGLAAYPGDSDDVNELLELADQALYAAKTAGRNMVTWPGMKVAPAKKSQRKTTPAN